MVVLRVRRVRVIALLACFVMVRMMVPLVRMSGPFDDLDRQLALAFFGDRPA